MVRYRINGQEVSGTELVRIANRHFTKGSHGLGRYDRPHTEDQAHHFLTRELVPNERLNVERLSSRASAPEICSNCNQPMKWNFATSRKTGKRICDRCEQKYV
jgi:hypothetical protein